MLVGIVHACSNSLWPLFSCCVLTALQLCPQKRISCGRHAKKSLGSSEALQQRGSSGRLPRHPQLNPRRKQSRT